jgi:cobalt-zinc-cadmium efflux system membrane fusion protein
MMRLQKSHIAAILCLFAGLVLLADCSRKQAEPDASLTAPRIEAGIIRFPAGSPQLGHLKVEPAEEQAFASNRLTGRLAWNDDVTARIYPPVSGRIVEILAQPGQRVSAGDVLAKIISPDFGQAQLDARKAKTDFQRAERTLTRVRELFEHKAAARKDVEAAEAEYANAFSEKERSLATLALYGGNANDASVTAAFSLKTPVNGIVVERAVTPGREVRYDQVGENPLFIISDPTKLWLFLDVTESDAALLRVNQKVHIRARNAPDIVLSGRIENISAGLDAVTRTIKALCTVDNHDRKMRAEMFVTAEVDADPTPRINVPSNAIFLKDNQSYLFVETTPGEFQRRAIRTGRENNGRLVILEGLSRGELVVTDGVLLLQSLLGKASSS